MKFDELNGEALDSLTLVLEHGTSAVFGAETATIRFEKFDLDSHVASFFATYGITDRWDVNVLLPVVTTTLDVRAEATLDNVVTAPCPGPPAGCHFFDVATFDTMETYSAEGREAVIEVRPERRFSPARLGNSSDRRWLGVAVGPPRFP